MRYAAVVVAVDQVEQVVDVAEALRHLLALGVDDEAVVHPVVGEALAEGDGLGPLVLVVREAQVLPAAVQVEALAEQVEAHHDALAVPARAARRPTATATTARPAWPASTARSRPGGACCSAPNDLALAAAGEHVVERLVGEQAVVLDRLDATGRRRRRWCRRAPMLDELADHRRPSRRRTRWRAGVSSGRATPMPRHRRRTTPPRTSSVISCHGRSSRWPG